MPTIATFGNRIDMLKGVFQLAPTDFSQGDIADFYAHCYQERQKELRSTGHFRITKKEFPASAIEHTTIRTEYIPVYRIHSKQYFQAGPNYGANWLLSERKRNNNERYSPFGTEGFYFGLTLPAAEHEARHYGEGQIDPKKYMILVMECCFDNILYLSAGAIGVVWEVVGLDPPESLMDMYLKIMDPNTNNKVTNAIGLWARREGFDGLIYPSARYGEEKKLQQKKAEGYNLIPIINFVSVGSHLCDGFTPLLHITHAFNNEINQLGGLDNCIPVFAESNLVLFDGKQIVENRHGVVYQTFPLELRDEVLEQDDTSRQTMSYTYWSTPEKPKWL